MSVYNAGIRGMYQALYAHAVMSSSSSNSFDIEEYEKKEEEKRHKERERAILATMPVPHDSHTTAAIPSASRLGRRIKPGGEEWEDGLARSAEL